MDVNENICITSNDEMTDELFGQVILFLFEILPIPAIIPLNSYS